MVRYNISQNDGRANRYGGLHVWGRVRQAEIYNNTVWVSAASGANPRGAIVSERECAAEHSGKCRLFEPAAGLDGPSADARAP